MGVLSLLVGLLVLCVFLSLAFWLVGLVVQGFGGPPQLRAAIVALLALLALVWLFGGYSPFYGPHVTLFR